MAVETATASRQTKSGRTSRIVVLAVAVLLLVAVAVAVAVVWVVRGSSSSHGPLVSTQATGDSGSPRGDVPVSIGGISFGNSGSKPAVITSIVPVSPTSGLSVRFLVGPAAVAVFGEQYGVYHHAGLRPPHGYVVAPSPNGAEPVGVVAILHSAAHRTRTYHVQGVNIHYRVGSSGYTLFVNEGMAVCYTFPYQPHHACNASIPVTPGSSG